VDQKRPALTSADGSDQLVKNPALGAATCQLCRASPPGQIGGCVHATTLTSLWPAHWPGWPASGGCDPRPTGRSLGLKPH
jgi:hypothetical protein